MTNNIIEEASEKIAKSGNEVENSDNNGEQQPTQKRKRLSNKEYKKLMKGQNKVKLQRKKWTRQIENLLIFSYHF